MQQEIVRDRLRLCLGKINEPTDAVARKSMIKPNKLKEVISLKVPFQIAMFLPFFIIYKINIDYVLGDSDQMFDNEFASLEKHISLKDLQFLFALYLSKLFL